jgi:carboxymethylenebutenolidase
MIITEGYTDIDTPSGKMRTFIFSPVAQGKFAAIVLYSEIYQMTGPIARTARRLACEGYIVAVPEVYHEFEPAGTALAYDKVGTDKGNQYKLDKTMQAFDDDATATLNYLKSRDDCNGKLATMGICLGGHLSFRAAVKNTVDACVCFYATDLHQQDNLGKDKGNNTLDFVSDLNAELLMIWGRQDPHIPQQGRSLVYQKLVENNILFNWHEFNAQHAFVRDEGHRYDAVLANICYDMVLEFLGRRLQMCEPQGLTENPGPNSRLC